MAGVLITGFEPFGGETVNPSWEVVKQLDGMIIRGQQVVAKQLPCVFGEGANGAEGRAGNLSTTADDCRRAGRRPCRYYRRTCGD